ncbi:DUF3168 domain-containing protein [Pararhodobacter zhoushanensis]|uniref:DUF3168 domain-containing protein n=1 Tax=Pararhodobacter zhoushanensis TaxID=2479545 RepID=UPI000F8ECE73|nr:DUF3168 domain-containing protein [Pararhodobacter zhoushanensis]
MEAEFRAILTGTSAITAIAPTTAINFGEAPQGTALPYVVLTTIGDGAGLTLKGSDGLSAGRVQVDCYASTASGAMTLGKLIRHALHGYRAGNFRLIEHVGTRDNREGGSNEPDRPHRRSQDFITHWRDMT